MILQPLPEEDRLESWSFLHREKHWVVFGASGVLKDSISDNFFSERINNCAPCSTQLCSLTLNDDLLLKKTEEVLGLPSEEGGVVPSGVAGAVGAGLTGVVTKPISG